MKNKDVWKALARGTPPQPGKDGTITLVYDQRAGLYYPVDSTGGYDRDYLGYTAEDLVRLYKID